MQASHKRKIENGSEYNYLFPKAEGKEVMLKWDANVWDTLDEIPRIVYETLNDTKKLAQNLKADTLDETCKNIWDFVYHHIQYQQDEEGTEQLRRPSRSWMDRVRGVDCDCYTVFISSILTNLNIPHTYRIAKYKHKTYYQHIYPIVPSTSGNYITIDCVVDKYDYEEPFTQKHDTPMNLSYLNGTDTEEQDQTLMAVSNNSDVRDLPDFQDFDGLGKIKFFQKIGEGLKKTFHVANVLNLATIPIRTGLLTAMKLNLNGIASELRWAYLTDEQAKQHGIDLTKLGHMRQVLKKVEGIFYGAGGSLKNLKKAILTGKGNKDKVVPLSGLGDTDIENFSGTYDYDENTPIHELLAGYDEGENELGAASGWAGLAEAVGKILTGIMNVISKIGHMKKNKDGTPDTGSGTGTSDTSTDNADGGTNTNDAGNTNSNSNGANVRHSSGNRLPAPSNSNTPATTNGADNNSPDDTGNNSQAPQTFSEKAKAWVHEHPVKATFIGLATAGLFTFGIIELHHHIKNKHKKPQQQAALSGAPHKKRRKKKGNSKKKHKKNIALL
jgi:hypothetical protein